MRIRLALTVTLALLVLIIPSFSLQVDYLTREADLPNPFIVEYIQNFEISTKDVENLLQNQFKSVTLGELKTSYTHLLNSTVSMSYYGIEKKT